MPAPDQPSDRSRDGHIVDGASDAIVTIDRKGTVLTANPAVETIFGWAPSTLIGRNIEVLVSPDVRERQKEDVQLIRDDGAQRKTVRYPGVRRDGSQVNVEISFGEFAEEGREGLIGIIRDVSEGVAAQRRLAESEEMFRDFFENAPIGCHSLGPDGRFTSINRTELAMIGYEYAEVVDKLTWKNLIIPEQHELFDKHWRLLEAQGQVLDIEYTVMRKDGAMVQVLASASARRDGSGRLAGTRGTVIDVTSERQAVQSLRNLTQQYRVLFERNLAGIFRGTLDGRVFECNDAYATILGYASRGEFLQLSGVDASIDVEERNELFRRLKVEKTISGHELSVRQRDGSPIWIVENLSLIDDTPGKQPIVEGTLFDITARKLAEERVAYQAYHDSLTGLPNPDLFRERFDRALESAARTDRSVALMFLDLDLFKSINDTRGHHIGNQLLQLVAYRLQKVLRQEDTVARLGGDEFTIVAVGLHSVDEAAIVAAKVKDALSKPFLLEGRESYVTASVGIAMYPTDGADYDTLLRKADIAMYHAKEAGRNRAVFSSEDRSGHAIEQMTLETDLRRALDQDEFVLYFQPVVDSVTNRVVAVEALLRWQHPERGLILPNNFIPVAERSHQIVPIGEWVLRQACLHAAEWQERDPNLRVSINLSPVQFQHPGFDVYLGQVLRETGVKPQLVELEITESAAMQNPELTMETLAAIKAMGVRVAIDDFGTGYSSLSYLSKLPIDTLKIDQGFVRDIEKDGNDSLIISAVIALAHQLNLTVIAEGVETEKQSAFLKERRCENLQGFLFSRPMPAEDIGALLLEPDGHAA